MCSGQYSTLLERIREKIERCRNRRERKKGRKLASKKKDWVMELEKEGFNAKHGGGIEIEQYRQGQKKGNSVMKGVVKKRMWVVLGKKKKEQRGKGNDWIPLGSEPVQLNNGSAEQYWLGWWGGRWQYAYRCSLSDFCCRRLSTLRKEFSFQPASWAINPTTCWSQRNCFLPFANLAPLKNKNRRGTSLRRCLKGCLQMLL